VTNRRTNRQKDNLSKNNMSLVIKMGDIIIQTMSYLIRKLYFTKG